MGVERRLSRPGPQRPLDWQEDSKTAESRKDQKMSDQ